MGKIVGGVEDVVVGKIVGFVDGVVGIVGVVGWVCR